MLELTPEARAALDDAACGLLETASDGRILFANRTFCTWLGRDAAALVGEQRLQDLFTMGGKIFHQTHWAPLLQMQGSISEVKFDVLHASGEVIPMVMNAVRRVREGVVTDGIAAYVARDRDTYERELLLSRKRLEELVEVAKDRALLAEQMVGIVSHDLRNPLSSVTLAMELLTRLGATEKQQQVIARVNRAAARANRLVLDLLDFTQARVGRGLSVSIQTIDLHETIAAIVEDLRLAHPTRVLRHVRSGEATCSADPNRLAQVVGNLVGNALTYGQRDQAVTVSSRVAEDWATVAVHNLGEPIPEPSRAQIFEPMQRGTSASSSVRSVGLGLFIVREIARAHGGTALVESSREQGTTFSVRFPRQRREPAADAKPKT
jgi:sigma-B regulation protein RsbU (phosphoserine phosphatase)